MTSAQILRNSDFCSRLEFLSRSYEKESLTPMQLLSRGIHAGLTSEAKDPGQSAGDYVMSLAVSRPIDTPQTDLLGLAEHTAALADMITWILRPGDPWASPGSVELGEHTWIPESYIGPGGLRRVVLVDRWSDERAIAESFDWGTLEGVIYDVPMTLIVVVLGASHDGRRHGPLAKGYLHPVSQDLRFKKRDGEPFGPSWNIIYREDFKGDREEWLESMTEDGVLDDHLILHQMEVSSHSGEVLDLASSNLSRLAGTVEPPSPQLAQCFDPIRKCTFRSCCPHFRMPSAEGGFLRIEGSERSSATSPALIQSKPSAWRVR